jgi:hypothetical protein
MVTFAECDTQKSQINHDAGELRTPSTDKDRLREVQLNRGSSASTEERSGSQSINRSTPLDVRVQDPLDTKRFGKLLTVTVPPGETFAVNYHRATEQGRIDSKAFQLSSGKEYGHSKTAAGELWYERQPDGSTKVTVATYAKHDELRQVGQCSNLVHNEEFKGYVTLTTANGKQTVHVNVGNGHTNDHLQSAVLKAPARSEEVLKKQTPSATVDRQVSASAASVEAIKTSSGVVPLTQPTKSSNLEAEKRDNLAPGVVLPEKNSTFSAKNPAIFQMDENGVLTVYHVQLLNSFRVGEAVRKGTVAGFIPPTTPHELQVHNKLVAKPGPFRGMEVRQDNRPGAPANQFLIWPTGDKASGQYVLSAARVRDETNRVAFTIIHAGVGASKAELPNHTSLDLKTTPASTPSPDGKTEVASNSRVKAAPSDSVNHVYTPSPSDDVVVPDLIEDATISSPSDRVAVPGLIEDATISSPSDRVAVPSLIEDTTISSPSDRIVLPGPIEVELGRGETLCLHYKTFGPDGKERARSLSAHAIRPDTVSTTIPGVGKITRTKDTSGRDVVRIEPMEGFSGEISTRPSTAKEPTTHPFKDYRKGEPTVSSHLVSKER